MKLRAKNDYLIEEIIADRNYFIKDDGSIWTCLTRAGRQSRPTVWRRKDYVHNGTYKRLRYKNRQLMAHRIVWRKFHGPLNEFLTINHKDGNGLNNLPSNLEHISQADNNTHRYRVLGYPGVKGFRKVNNDLARQIRREWKAGATLNKMAARYSLAKSTLSYIVNNKSWKDEAS